MQFNVDHFTYYKAIAQSIFNYLNGRVNKYCTNVILEVDYADYVNYTFANLRKPNMLTLHLQNIVEECGGPYNKNKVYSMLFIVIGHELTHVDQLMSQQMYKKLPQYKEEVERSTDYTNYLWLKEHKTEIDRIFMMDLDLSYYRKLYYFNNTDKYQAKSIKDYYMTLFRNVIFRDDEKFSVFANAVLEKYENIFVCFNSSPNVLIKNNGEFCAHTLSSFIAVTWREIGLYDHYTMSVSLGEPNRDAQTYACAYVTIRVSDRQINPAVFGKR